ncbi:MAG TPA: MFS transporter, partial [Nitrolancea sp.]|nr:MFS transporter [Nitrolancea sp.]
GGMRKRFAAAWIAPWRNYSFRWVFLTRGSVMLGLDLFLTFIAYYFASVEHVANFAAVTAALAVLALVGAAASAFGIGLLSDRIGRVGLVCFASACMAAAALVFVAQPGAIPLWPLGLLFGLGFGAYSSVDWALAVDVLPSPRNAGKDMGLWSMASNLPAIVAPLLGGGVIAAAAALGVTAAGYRALFALAALFMLLGAAFILLVRETVGARKLPPGQRLRRRIALGWRLAPARGGRPRGWLRFWPVYERFWRLFHRVQPIPGVPHDLLRVQFARYHGRPITLPDGTRVRRGDLVGTLHLNNPAVSRVAAEGSALRLLPMLAGDLTALAGWLASDAPPGGGDVRAICGVTLLARGAARLGFTLRERPRTLYTRLDGFFMSGLLALYNPAGLDRLRRGTTYGRGPVEMWMSRAELLRRYGQRQPDGERTSD